jgi:hypothetical protein
MCAPRDQRKSSDSQCEQRFKRLLVSVLAADLFNRVCTCSQAAMPSPSSQDERLWNVGLNADETSPSECVVVRSLRSFAAELWAALGDKGGDSLLRIIGGAGHDDRILFSGKLVR